MEESMCYTEIENYFLKKIKYFKLLNVVWLWHKTFFIAYNQTYMYVHVHVTVRAEIFAVVLFSRISRVKPSRKFPLQFMSNYSNDNIS